MSERTKEIIAQQVSVYLQKKYEGLTDRLRSLPEEERGSMSPEAFVEQMIQREAKQLLPIALALSRKLGGIAPLSENDFHEAVLRASQSQINDTLNQFETRLGNSPNMPPHRRLFAQAFLKMSRRHQGQMESLLTDVHSITEEDLEKQAKTIADDLMSLIPPYLPDENENAA